MAVELTHVDRNTFRACFFCSRMAFKGKADYLQSDPTTLHNHVGNHQHYFCQFRSQIFTSLTCN